MALNTRLAATSAVEAANAVVDRIDVGSGAAQGKVEIRTGTQPADPDTAATGTLLVSINFQNPAFGGATDTGTGGQAAVAGTPSGTASGDGTAGYFRVYDRDGNPVWDGECGTSGADMNLDNLSIATGQTVTINTFTYTHPQS